MHQTGAMESLHAVWYTYKAESTICRQGMKPLRSPEVQVLSCQLGPVNENSQGRRCATDLGMATVLPVTRVLGGPEKLDRSAYRTTRNLCGKE